MTDYVSQVAFCRKPLMVAKADISELGKKVERVRTRGTRKVVEVEVEETILKGRTVSKESIAVLHKGKIERHCLYQSPDKLTYNQVIGFKGERGSVGEIVGKSKRRYLLWGSPSDCYNRMFGGTTTEGGLNLPCINPGLRHSRWSNAKLTGKFHGAYHPKYWGMDWAYQQWVEAQKLRREEGRCIEEAIRRQIRSEDFPGPESGEILRDTTRQRRQHVTDSNEALHAFKIPAWKRRGSGENRPVHNSAESKAAPEAKQALQVPEIFRARSRSVLPKPMGDRHERKPGTLSRDSWILVPKQQSSAASNTGSDKVPSLLLTSAHGHEYELVERPSKIPRLGASADEAIRRKQVKLAADFERWDLYVKRKEEHFANRGDLTDNTSDMMKAFRVEERAAERARAWWKREQAIRDQTWTYDADEYANAALEARYHQLFAHFLAMTTAGLKEVLAAEKEEQRGSLAEIELREIAKLFVLGIVVVTKEGYEGGHGAVITDRLMAKLWEHEEATYQIIVNDESVSLEALVADRASYTEMVLETNRNMPKTLLLPGDTASI